MVVLVGARRWGSCQSRSHATEELGPHTHHGKHLSRPWECTPQGPLQVTSQHGLSGETKKYLYQSINAFLKEVLDYGQHWSVIFRAVEADPTCCMAQILAVDYYIAKGNGDGIQKHLSCAQSLREQSNAREQLYCDAFSKWMQGDSLKAFEVFLEIVKRWPMDLFALKRGTF